MNTSTKAQRVEVRLADWQKQLLLEAAALEGVNMTDFILMKTLDAARATIKETQDAILSLSQRMKIAEIISNPIPAPVTADLLALREHSINFNLSSLKENNRNGTDLTKPRTTRS